MTNPTPEAATFAPMTFHRLPLALLAAATLTAPLRAQDPDLRELLRDALYTEEVTRDPEAAAKQYEALLSKHDAQRAFAASALFRLAEVRRKQDRKDEAIALYQRLLRDFPAAEVEGKLARGNLAAMGAKVEIPASPAGGDEEDKELSRLEALAITNPDTISDPSIAARAVGKGHLKILQFFIEKNPSFDFNRELKGRSTTTLLYGASESGALEACRMLLDAGADPNAPANRLALSLACENGFSRIVELLLAKGSDPNGHGSGVPLWLAIAEGHPEIVSLLVGKGANPNLGQPEFSHAGGAIPIDIRTSRFGAPIHCASMQESTEMLELLLKLGADPDLAETSTGLTALHLAANPDWNGNAKAIPILLKAGAKPDLAAKAFRENTTEDEWPAGLTPLMVAVRSKNFEAARTLLEAGASANQPRLLADLIDQGPEAIPLIQLLLESGCDPNAADPSGVPPIMQVFFWNLKSLENGNEKFAEHLKQVELIQLLLKHGADIHKTDREGRTVLFHAVDQNNLEAVNLLLAKGADPNRSSDKASILSSLVIDDQPENLGMLKAVLKAGIDPNLADQAGVTLLQRAVAKPTYQAVHLLLEHGAQPPEDWINGKFDRGRIPIPDRRIQGLLIRHCLFPRWMKEPAVRLSHPDSGSDLILAERIGDAPVPPLARLLVDWDGRVEGGPPNRISGLLVHRSNADGSTTTSRIAINSPEPYPELQWGDVLEVEKADPEDDGVLGFGWHPETRIALYRHLSFPVTVELPGSTRQIKIVGGRLTYDPAANEAPWVGAGALVWLLWNPTHSTRGIDELGLTVKRSGWPDVSLKFSDPNCWSFRLEPGDTLSLNLPPDFDQRMATARKTSASLRIAGGAVTRVYGTSETSPLPTLAQAITDAYGFWDASSFEDDYERHEGQIVRSIRSGSLAVPVDIPRPDFSRIRLRRLDASGVETVTVIDWEKLIRESGAAMTAADARGQDIDLKAGDIVELALKDDRSGDQWKGFTPDETRFFSLTLASRFQVVDGNGRLQLREFRWSPPDWKLVDGHLLPFPPKSGFLSARASRIGLRADFNNGQTRIRLVRGEKIWDNVGFDDLFVRDGDQISKAPPIQRPSR